MLRPVKIFIGGATLACDVNPAPLPVFPGTRVKGRWSSCKRRSTNDRIHLHLHLHLVKCSDEKNNINFRQIQLPTCSRLRYADVKCCTNKRKFKLNKILFLLY